MTKRQWLILQQALVTYQFGIAVGHNVSWDPADGPQPTPADVDAVATQVGVLEYIHDDTDARRGP